MKTAHTNEEWMRLICDAVGRPDYQILNTYLAEAKAEGYRQGFRKGQLDIISLVREIANLPIKELESA